MMFTIVAMSALFGSSAMAWKWGGLDEKLAAFGFAKVQGSETAYVRRVRQPGTQGAAVAT